MGPSALATKVLGVFGEAKSLTVIVVFFNEVLGCDGLGVGAAHVRFLHDENGSAEASEVASGGKKKLKKH